MDRLDSGFFMNSNSTRARAIAFAACALLASAILLFFGTGLQPIWWLTWFAPLPVLLIADRVRALWAFVIAAIASFLGGLNMWHYLHGVFGAPISAMLAFLLVPACVFGLAILAFRYFIRRGSLWRASFTVPAIWVAYEYLNAVTSPHSTFGNVAYSQMDCLPTLQIASITGVWGIGFLLFLLPATIAALLSGRGDRAQKNRLAVVIGGVFVLVILFGCRRLFATPAPQQQVTVVLMSSDLRENRFPMNDPGALRLLGAYSDRVLGLTPRLAGKTDGGLIFVLPEKIAVISDTATAQTDALFKATAARAKATIVVGLDRGTREKRSNEARVYSPEGTLEAVYVKHHLIPGFEDVDRPGTSRVILKQPEATWGVEICKDMDFPRLSREYGGDGVGLLLVPAWDFVIDGWLHDRMAVMRGVESGFTIARTAKQGLMTVSDNRGRVSAQQSSGAAPFSILIAAAPVSHSATLYALWGNWFAWLDIAALIIMPALRT